MPRVRYALLAALAATTLTAPITAPYALAATRSRTKPICLDPVIPCPAPAEEPPDPTPTPSPQPTAAPKTHDPVAYRGLGTWVDAYDFSREFSKAATKPGSVDDMARQGVKTLYIQAAKDKDGGGTGVLSPDLLGQFLERAHAHKMRVVAWYLPRFVDPGRDGAHVDAMLRFTSHGHRFDSIGIDIESREVGDVNQRNDRLVALSANLRKAAGATAVSAIVVPPVVTDVINPKFWPNFPWSRIKSSYDVWLPMSYYTTRGKQPEWRDAYKYSSENVKLLRKDLGNAGAAVHVVGGVGTDSTANDYDGLVRAARDAKCLGTSSYDYAVTAGSAWATLRRGPA
jgi:hypothetical protein